MDGGGAEVGEDGTAGGVSEVTMGSCVVGGGSAGGVPEILVGTEEVDGERDGLVGVGNKPAGIAGRQADRDRIKSRVQEVARKFMLKSYHYQGFLRQAS